MVLSELIKVLIHVCMYFLLAAVGRLWGFGTVVTQELVFDTK